MYLKSIQSLLERVKICKPCWKTEELAEFRFFLPAQDKQGTQEQPSQNKKQPWIIQVMHTVLRIQY